MKSGLNIGVTAELRESVGAEKAILLGEGGRSASVFSTPSMINLMEHAARLALKPFLDSGEESVGATVQVNHLTATPLGAAVRATATVTKIDGKQIDFDVEAFDDVERIGQGTHRRFVIQTERFADRLKTKSAQLPSGGALTMSLSPNTGTLQPFQTLAIEQSGPILTVHLNRPQKLNAVNQQMTTELRELNNWLAGHPEIRVVIITGRGDAFCAGDDVPEVGKLSENDATELSLQQATLYLNWERLPQVFIAAVNGASLGAGCVMACACDFRIAAHSARFGMPEILLGWPPGYGIAQLISLIGKGRAMEMCVLGQPVTAQMAATYGLVLDVVPLGKIVAASRELASRLLALPAEALRETKRLVHLDEGPQSKIAYLADTASYIRCLQRPDAREGIAAFSEKRPPRFTE